MLTYMAQNDGFSGIYKGLTEDEAQANLKMYGFNTDNKLEEDGKGFRAVKVFVAPRFLLMVLACAVMFISAQIAGGVVMLFLTGAYIFTEIYKGIKSDEQVCSFKAAFSMKMRVIRGGDIVLIDKNAIVPDDIIVLQGGEIVPADAHLLEINNVTADESIFTDDKTPVRKILGADTKNDLKQSCIYKGTKIIDGTLVARVTATGVDTKKYKTFGAAIGEEFYFTDFENAINRLSPVFSVIALVMLFVCAVYSFIALDMVSENTVIDLLTEVILPSVAFSLCMIPAETASLVRIYYITGAKNLARKHSQVRDLRVLESLNSLTAICIDKSVAITSHNIEVCEEYGKNIPMLLNISVLTCDIKPTSAIDKAIIVNATFKQTDVKELTGNEILRAYPFDESKKIAGNLWRIEDTRLLCIKGAPENVLSLCDLSQQSLFSIQKKKSAFSRAGNQVLAVAYAILSEDDGIPDDFSEMKFSFIGLLSMTNKTRDNIPFAIKSCYRAGVKVIMTTGDSAETASAIAGKIGLKKGNIITGDMLKSAEEYGEPLDLSDVNIFAEITQKQKAEVIRRLQSAGEIVAITGENAGESELLEQADIGITMSQSSSGATFEASDLLMNDDNFDRVVETIKDSRQVHRNVKNCIAVVLAAQICLWLFSLVNFFIGRELLITADMISLLSVVIIPLCALMFVRNNSDIKEKLTASGFIGRGVMNKHFFIRAALQGTAIALFSLVVYLISPDVDAQNRSSFLILFVSGLISCAWENITGDRPLHTIFKTKNRFGLIMTLSLLLFTLMLIYIPYVNGVFGLAAVQPFIAVICVIMGVFSQLFVELYKRIIKKDE